MIWLIDYTHYKLNIDTRLKECRRNFFMLKRYKRYMKIGETAPVKTKVYSTGLLRIATILFKNKVDVKYLHYYMLEDILDASLPLPEIVAFSCICPTVPLCADLCNRIKKISPNTKVYIGGVHINVAAAETQKRYPVFDKLIIGYEKNAAEQIANRSLDDYACPYVDFSLLPYPLSDYAINTFTTAGCPFHCRYCVDGISPHFCASNNGQIDDMIKLLPPKTLVHFFDSVLGYSEEGLQRVCESIKNTNHPFLLSCDMRADMMTPLLIRNIEDAGFVEIRLGMESADTKLLQQNERTLSFETFKKKLIDIRDYSNLYIALYTVTGLPGTTWTTQECTLQACDSLLKDGLVDEIKNAMYVPYPMQHLDYTKQGITIECNDWSKYDRQSYPVYRTESMTSDELFEMYIETAERINQSWLESLGFSNFDQVPIIQNYYSEYMETNYLINKNTDGGNNND